MEDIPLGWDNVTPIEERHRGEATVYDAELSPPCLTPSSNRRSVAWWYLDGDTLPIVLASPLLEGEVL